MTCLVAAFVVTSLGEGVGTVSLPTFLDSSMSSVPLPFRFHILACCCGVAAGSAAFTAALIGRAHRSMGRLALMLLVVGAVASVPVAVKGASSPLAKAAFLGQAATLVVASLIGGLAGHRGRVRLHRACMIYAALALSGAPLSRLVLKLPNLWLNQADGYAAAAWFSWLAPFAVAACLRAANSRPVSTVIAGASS